MSEYRFTSFYIRSHIRTQYTPENQRNGEINFRYKTLVKFPKPGVFISKTGSAYGRLRG